MGSMASSGSTSTRRTSLPSSRDRPCIWRTVHGAGGSSLTVAFRSPFEASAPESRPTRSGDSLFRSTSAAHSPMTSSGPRTSGLRVFDEAGREVGVVQRVVFGPGQDRLEITTGDGASFEVPFVDELVPVVDLGAGRIEINSIPGLIEPG